MTTIGALLVAYLALLALMLAGVVAPVARTRTRGTRERATMRWAGALGLQLAAWVLLGLRWAVPVPWLEPLACGLLLAGYGEMARGLALEATGRDRGRTLHLPAVATVLVLGIVQAGGAATQDRLLLFWACAFAVMVLSLWALSGLYTARMRRPERALGMLFAAAVPLLAWRLVAQVVAPADGPALRGGISVVQAVVLVYFVLLPVVATAGFLHVRHRRRHERIHYLATHDPLTGLRNRTSFVGDAQQALHDGARRGRAASLVMLDIDRFKDINDALGHAGGDAALGAVADAVRGALRRRDTAARYGGDEFAVLLRDTDARRALEIARDIAAGVAEIALPGRGPGRVTVSMGVASTQGVGESVDALVRRADASLYRAKQEGRDRIVADGATQDTATAH